MRSRRKRTSIAQAKDGYQRNVTVHSCINLISRNAAAVPWVLYNRRPGSKSSTKIRKIMTFNTAAKSVTAGWRGKASAETSEIENHPLLTLIEKPNPMQGGGAYLEEVLSYLHISGNAFETWIGPDTGPNRGKPTELWTLRSDRIRIVGGLIGSGRTISAYRYYAGVNSMDFAPEIILHQKFFHPLDDFWGLSPVQVAALVIDGDNAAALWNKKLLENDARPAMGLVVKGAISDPAVRERLKKELEERYSGPNNARRPMVLEGDLDMKPLALTPAELDWLEGRKMNRHEIAQVYNVPPGLVDPEMMGYASAEQDRKKLYQENICPLLDRRRDSLNNTLARAFGEGLWLDYDRDQIDALHDDNSTLYQGLATATWLSENEKRAATGYDQYIGDPENDNPADVPEALRKGDVPPALADAAGLPPKPGTPTPPKPEPEPGIKSHAYSRDQKKAAATMEKRVRALFRRQQKDLIAYLSDRLKKLT
jgi:HK97 family phage portal protein